MCRRNSQLNVQKKLSAQCAEETLSSMCRINSQFNVQKKLSAQCAEETHIELRVSSAH
jgi:hypothetical protein